MRRAAVCFVAISLALACSRPAQLVYEAEVAETPIAARHAVHSERIRELMASIALLERGRLPQAMDVDLERDRRIDDVARVALELAECAEQLADISSELALEPGERDAFVAFARELERDSLALAEESPVLSVAAMRERADEIRADCNRCHEQFRGGPIPAEP